MVSTLRVAMLNRSDFSEIFYLNDTGYEEINGIEYEFLKLLSEKIPFKYKIVHPSDNEWGIPSETAVNGTGMMGMLQRNEADIALSSLFVTLERFEAAQVSFPYLIDPTGFCMKMAGRVSSDFAYVHPFTFPVWMLSVLTVVVVSFVLSCFRRESTATKNAKHRKSFFNIILSSIEMVVGYKGFENISQTFSCRLFVGISLLLIRILVFSYVGVLLSFLMAPQMEHQIHSVRELAEVSSKGLVKVTTYDDLKDWFPSSPDDPRIGLSKHVKENPKSGWIDQTESPIELIMNGYAMLIMPKISRLEFSKMGMKDKIFISADSLRTSYASVLLRKDLCGLEKFNIVIERILQADLYNKIYSDHIFKLLYRVYRSDDNQGVRPINFSEIKGVFIILLIGHAVATAVLFWEKYNNKRNKQ